MSIGALEASMARTSVHEPTATWRLPLHRFGAVIKGSRNNSETKEKDEIKPLLELDQAKSALDRMLSPTSYGHYTKALWSQIEGVTSDERNAWAWRNSPNVRFRPGPIVDFPKVEIPWTFDGTSYVISASLCVTICLFEDRSKIWFRFLLKHTENTAAENIRKPLGETLLRAFRETTESWTAVLLGKVLEQYREDILAARGDENASRGDLDLSIMHMVQFLAVDSEIDDFDELALDAAKGETLAEIERTSEADGAAKELRRLLEIFAPEKNTADAELFEHTTSRGRTGVFAFVPQGKRAVYIGLGALAPGESFDAEAQNCGALQASAEMAFALGRLF